jgi:hypothetical protein
MTLLDEALALDVEAESLAKNLQTTFIRIGRVMDRMTGPEELWRLLGGGFQSQEDWVQHRFRDQRSTAFKARGLYRALQPNIPDVVMEHVPRGSLEILSQLPESAQRDLKVQELAVMSTPAEFTAEAINRYPKHFLDKRIKWALNPTIPQAANYDRIFDFAQTWYSAEMHEPITRENAFELLLMDFERSILEQAAVIATTVTGKETIQ